MTQPHLQVEQTDGRPREVSLREVVNTLRYIEKTGVQWSMLPHDLPAKSTVYEYHSRWAKDGTWDRVVADLNAQARKATPSLMIVVSQSTETALGDEQLGYDSFKKVKGRKRRVLTDVLGLLWAVNITAANLNDGQHLVPLVNSLGPSYDPLEKILADGAYGIRNHPEQFEEAFEKRLELEISSTPTSQRSFVPAKIRWVVERCFAWLGNSRRLSKDYERTIASSKAFVQNASLRRAFTFTEPVMKGFSCFFGQALIHVF